MKSVKKYLILVLVLVIAGTAILPKENIIAKKKSKVKITEYYAAYDGNKTGIKKVKIKKNSIVVWGSCKRYKFEEGGDIWKSD